MNPSKPAVTLFGPVHVGKSTLAGLLLYQEDPERCERAIARARRRLHEQGAKFRNDGALAYLVDRSKDERTRWVEHPAGAATGSADDGRHSASTSKRLHIVRGKLDASNDGSDIVVVDTPGGWKIATNQRMRGIFYADIAVYMFDVNDIEALDKAQENTRVLLEMVGALFSWAAIRSDAPLIIAISKMDSCADMPEASFEMARSRIARYLDDRCNPVFVPISIDIDARRGTNIFDADNRFAWFEGPNLIQAICDAREKIAPVKENSSSFMLVTRSLERTGFGTGYFGKVHSGRFEPGMRARLLPLKSARGEESSYTGLIRTIEASDTREHVNELATGELGGIFFSGNNKGRDTRSTTIIVDEKTPIAIGSFLRIRVASAMSWPAWFHFRSDISILWMGRFHRATIYEISLDGDDVIIGAQLQSADRFACPVNLHTGTVMFGEAVLWPPNHKFDTLDARIVSIGTAHSVRLKTTAVGDLFDDPRSLWAQLEHPGEDLPVGDASLGAAINSLIERLPEDLAPGSPTRNFTILDSGWPGVERSDTETIVEGEDI